MLARWGGDTGVPGLNDLTGIAVGEAGNFYVTGHDHCVQEFTSNGEFFLKWGSFGSEDGQFVSPAGIATDRMGSFYVTDRALCRVQKFGDHPVPTTPTTWGRIKAERR